MVVRLHFRCDFRRQYRIPLRLRHPAAVVGSDHLGLDQRRLASAHRADEGHDELDHQHRSAVGFDRRVHLARQHDEQRRLQSIHAGGHFPGPGLHPVHEDRTLHENPSPDYFHRPVSEHRHILGRANGRQHLGNGKCRRHLYPGSCEQCKCAYNYMCIANKETPAANLSSVYLPFGQWVRRERRFLGTDRSKQAIQVGVHV